MWVWMQQWGVDIRWDISLDQLTTNVPAFLEIISF